MEVVITSAIRTPIGNLNGTLAGFSASHLGSLLIKQILESSNISGKDLTQIIIGQVLTAGCGQNPARQSAVYANVPYAVPSFTVNQVCGSGMQAIILGYQSILTEAVLYKNTKSIVMVGGQESMSRAPHAANLRSNLRIGNVDMIDTLLNGGLMDVFISQHMGITAENIVNKLNISREEQDEFAYNSHIKALAAKNNGRFKNEMLQIKVKDKRRGDMIMDYDELTRSDISVDTLSKLRPAFINNPQKGGTVTAGNSSGINDGAAMLLMMTREEAEKRELEPMAKIVSYAFTGIDPKIMGLGPINAINKALKSANWKIEDVNLIELNEAFAAQSIGVINELSLNKDIVNVNGGAIALGHPIGASGARVVVTLVHEMLKRNAPKGLAALCIGGGMGIALCVELV